MFEAVWELVNVCGVRGERGWAHFERRRGEALEIPQLDNYRRGAR